MKAKNLFDKIECVCTFKNGKHKKDYWHIVRLLKRRKAKHHYLYYCRGYLLTDKVPLLLKAIGVDYATGNDAPRGGKTGNFVYLTPKGKRQVRELVKSNYYNDIY